MEANNADELTCLLQKYKQPHRNDPIPDINVTSYHTLYRFDFGGGKTILHVAIERNHPSIIEQIFQSLGAEAIKELLNKKDKKGYTAIMYAAFNNQHEILTFILRSIKDTDTSTLPFLLVPGMQGLTAAHSAAKQNNYRVIESMLLSLENAEERLELLMSIDTLGFTVLHRVVCRDSLKSVQCVIGYLESDHLHQLMKIQKDEHELTVLHTCAFKNNIAMIETLLSPLTYEQISQLLKLRMKEGGIDSFKGIEGKTAKELASMMGKKQVVEFLEIMADITDSEAGDEGSVHRVAIDDKFNVMKAMLHSLNDAAEQFRLIMHRDRLGFTVLHRAVCCNSLQTVHCVLDCLAGDQLGLYHLMKVQGGQHNLTVFHTSAFNNNIAMIKKLLDYLTDEQQFELLNIRNKNGKGDTAEGLACSLMSRTQLVEFLSVTKTIAYIGKLSEEDQLEDGSSLWKDNLLQTAAADNDTSFIKKTLSEQHITEIKCALNSDGLIPYNLTNDHEVQEPLCEQLNNAEFELYDLNNPEDDLVVTAVVMTTKSDGRVYTLFKLIAGEMVDSPETEEEDLRVVTVCMNNNLLHDMITHECDARFISNLEENKRPKWQQHCPCFIVTHEAPHYDASGSIILIDGTIDGKDLQGSEGSRFDFTHPANKEVGFRILEPASPPRALIMAPKFHGKPKPSHAMEKKESTRMHPDVQKLLVQEQRKLISALCQHREHDGDSKDAVTAVVWATLTVNEETREKGRPQTGVVLVNGILLGMKNSILDGDNSAGRIVNLKWFHSSSISAKIPENKCLNIDPDLLISEGEICMTDTPGDGEAGTLTVEAKQQSVRVKFGHGPPWDFHKLNSQQILNPTPTYLPFENVSDEVAKVLPEFVGASIDRKAGEVVVSVHETIAPTSLSPANFRFRRDLFVLLAKGNREDINLPNTFTYRDPLHLWVVQTWLEAGNPQIWSLIHNNRPLQRPDDCSVAEHILLHKAADEKCAKTLELTYKEGFRIKNKKLPLESWSHGPNDKSLKHELQQNIGFQSWKSGLKLNIQSSALEQLVKDEFPIDLQNLPESFKHPTIQFSMKNLPGPNQMGMGIQTEKPKELAAATAARDDHITANPNQVREVRSEQLFNPEQAIGKQIGKVSAANTEQKVTPKDRQPDHDIKMIPAATSEFAIIVEDNSQEIGTKPKNNYKRQGYGSSSSQPYQSKSSKIRNSISKPGCLAIPDGKDLPYSSAPGQTPIAPKQGDGCAFPGMLPALSPKSCDYLYDSNDNEAHFKFVNSSVYNDPGSHKGKEQLIKRITELIRNNKL